MKDLGSKTEQAARIPKIVEIPSCFCVGRDEES
jgi:hypothetical protein